MPRHDTSFAIESVAGFAVRLEGTHYWEGYRQDNRVETGRFLLKPGWRTVYTRDVESPVIKVRLRDGTIGWGEATAPICPEVVCHIATNLLAPFATGREFGHPRELWDLLYDLNRGRGHVAGFHLEAMAAIDVAIWDALGRRAGVPVAALLSDEPRRAVPVYLSGIRRNTLDERIAHLRTWAEGGMRGVKLFLDRDIDAARREVEAIRAGVPAIDRVMIDVLWSFDDVDEAKRAKRVFGEAGVHWLECPLIPEDMPGHVALVRHEGTPIALGEHFFTHYQSELWFRARALDIFQPDICRTGLSDGVRQRDAAAAVAIPTTPHMGNGFAIVQAAALQFAAATPGNLLCEYQAGLSERAADVFDTAWRFENGKFTLPDRPGLGVEVNEDALAKYAARSYAVQ